MASDSKDYTAYVYEYVSELTGQWHSGGGALVITQRDPLEALREETGLETESDHPPKSFPVEAEKEQVFIFPDAGCC